MKFYNQQNEVYSLNRGWKFAETDVTAMPPGIQHDDVYGYAKGDGAKGPADAAYDDSSWEKVELPHDWVTKHDFTKEGSPNQGYKERGIGWYRMSFELPKEDKNKQLSIEFEGLSCDAEIYLNGALLKRNFSGYNSFSLDITDMANFGVIPNTLAVRIDATAWEGWWYEGAGIYRNVWLVKKPALHIAYQGLHFKSTHVKENVWDVTVTTSLANAFEVAQETKLQLELVDVNDNIIWTESSETKLDGYDQDKWTVTTRLDNIQRWSIEEPTLYTLKVALIQQGNIQQEEQIRVGFRTIRLDAATGFYLNGESVKLKGFCNHQDHAGVGAAVPYTIKEYRIKKLKELGANAYRCAHNPDPEILDLCDEYGLMVMEENRTFRSDEYQLQLVEDMVKIARNHPSVILYSVLNEEPLQGTHKGRRIAGRLQATVKRFDDTRPVLGAFNGGYMEEEGAATILDAVGINYNPARYDEFHAKYPNVPLIGSETASAFMVRGEYETDYDRHVIDGYDEQCALWGNTVSEAWKYVVERPYVAGTFVWTGFDYRGEPTPFVWPSVATFFGTYDSCGFEKDACYFYKAFWKEEPMVHLVSPWSICREEGEQVRVMVITNCSSVTVMAGEKEVFNLTNGYKGEVTIPYEALQTLKAVGYDVNGTVVATDTQTSWQAPATLSLEASHTCFNRGGYDAIAVNVSVMDENRTVCGTANDRIQVQITGGTVIGVGNGDPNSHEPDVAMERSAYHGKAQFIVKANGDEPVCITAQYGEIKSELLTLPVKPVEHIPYYEVVDEVIIGGWGMYYKLSDSFPDPNPNVDANDRNSFEPVAFSGEVQPQFSEQLGKYGLYRTVFQVGNAQEGRYLYLGDIKGHAWIYINGVEVASRTDSYGGHMIVDLSEKLEGEQVLSIVIHNSNREWPQAGICMPVKFKKK